MTATDVVTRDLAHVLAHIAAEAAAHDRAGTFPHEAFPVLHKAGVLNLTIPVEVGGAGAGLATVSKYIRLIGAADPSVALVAAQHLMFHAELARPGNAWPADLREEVQRSSIEGVALVNGLRVEPELGTPARGGLPATTASRITGEGGWAITGRKIYSTGSPALRWLIVWARTDEPDPRVGSFLVERRTPGWRLEETWDHLGLRASGSHDVIFEGATVPFEHAVDVRRLEDFGGVPPTSLAWNNLLIPSIYTGVAHAAKDWLVGYLNDRTPSNLGAPLASLPRFQQVVGEIEALLFSNDQLISGLATLVDQGDADAAAGSGLVKHVATTNAIQSVELCLELTGNPGLSRKNPLERHYRDVLCGRVHTPQSDTILTGRGRVALGYTPARIG